MQCDEQLPVCTRCVKRGEKCSFLATASEQDSPTSHSNSNGTPRDCSAEQHSRQLLELELMHQWSTGTCKTMKSSRPNSATLWSITLPRLALKYEYLLDGIFSFAALHLAHEHQADPRTMDDYLAAGLSFRARGMQRAAPTLQEYQNADHEPEAGDLVAMFWFSALAGVTSIALTVLTRREPANFATPELVTGRAFINLKVELSQLWRGTRAIGQVAVTMDTEDQVYMRWEPYENQSVDADTEAALSQLETFVSKPAPTPSSGVVDEDHTPLYRQSAKLVRNSYASFAAGRSIDEALGWSPILDTEYAPLLKEGAPRALLCMMCYGTLLDKFSNHWWVQDAGRMLVQECSSELAGCPEEWYPLIRWARTRVGLPEASPASPGPSDPPSTG